MSRPTIKIGATGNVVAILHQALTENGFPCAGEAELSLPVFGPGTLEAVKLFQSCNVGPDGENLAPDGVVGPRTWWSLEDVYFSHDRHEPGFTEALPDMPVQQASNPVAAAALASAWAECGRRIRESPDGSNRGPQVDIYTGFSGKPPTVKGPPWCAYFASWNFAKAPGGSPFGKVGGARSIVDYCREHFPGSVVDASDPGAFARTAPLVQAGDMGVIETGPGHGHVFHVAAVRDGLLVAGVRDGLVWTVEGNSGNAVRTRRRLVSSARWYVNFDRYARERGL
jgi:hypothetical protein